MEWHNIAEITERTADRDNVKDWNGVYLSTEGMIHMSPP